jgi:hypothetical protein
MNDQLVPKHPKRKRQPSAAVMREQLALAADEIIRLRGMLLIYVRFPTWPGAPPNENPFAKPKPAPWWKRLFRKPVSYSDQGHR